MNRSRIIVVVFILVSLPPSLAATAPARAARRCAFFAPTSLRSTAVGTQQLGEDACRACASHRATWKSRPHWRFANTPRMLANESRRVHPTLRSKREFTPESSASAVALQRAEVFVVVLWPAKQGSVRRRARGRALVPASGIEVKKLSARGRDSCSSRSFTFPSLPTVLDLTCACKFRVLPPSPRRSQQVATVRNGNPLPPPNVSRLSVEYGDPLFRWRFQRPRHSSASAF